MPAPQPLTTALCQWPADGQSSELGPPEWAMVELQGTLAVAKRDELDEGGVDHSGDMDIGSPNDRTNEDEETVKKTQVIKLQHEGLAGQTLGALTFENGLPILEIGVHRLEGKVVKIPKPFAIMERVESTSSDDLPSAPAGGARFAIRGIVRQKLLFKTRPKPLVGKRTRFV
mmetsp:Transcript_18218/g.35790  ORF Transcript_18218/g.35790 Transcript_18218/m.35790 type:complete len:172 (+) Transcript_18218:115-630(+)